MTMLRTTKYMAWLVAQNLGVMVLLAALLCAFYAATTPAADFFAAGGRVTSIAFAFGPIFALLIQASLVQTYLRLPLSMGATRRGFFAGLQAAKILMTAGICAGLALLQAAVGALFGTPPLFDGVAIAYICALLLVSACLGEVFGFLSQRFGRAGMILFTIFVALAAGVGGGIIGYSGASGSTDFLLAALTFVLAHAWLPGILALGVSVLLTGASWLMCRRITIRG